MNDTPCESDKTPLTRTSLMPYCWLASGMLAIAVLFRMPYGYYQLMRFVVCGVAVFCTFKAHEGKKKLWVFLAGAVALIFNPFVPIRFHRDIWQVLDFLFAVLMPIIGQKTKPVNETISPKQEVFR